MSVGYAAVGFDGYVDRLARVVEAADGNARAYFPRIAAFAAHVGAMAGLSGDMELEHVQRRFGGNAPLIAGALAALGIDCHLVGAVDDPAFDAMPPGVRRIALARPGDALALEFEDGKVMLADICAMRAGLSQSAREDGARWRAGLSSFANASLCVLTNWSAMPEMEALWRAALGAIAQRADAPMVYLDLADPSKRSDEAVSGLADMLAQETPRDTDLGVNEKELFLLCRKLKIEGADEVARAAALLHARVQRAIVVHGIGYALSCGPGGLTRRDCAVVARPRLTTGGGDHFSAGWCFARMQGWKVAEALDFANAVSGAYVADGASPSLERARLHR